MMEEYSPFLPWSAMASAHLCRLCGKETENPVQIFSEEGVKLELQEKIHNYLPILVAEEDLLPLNVCVDCLIKLENFHEFHNSCYEVNMKLIDQLKAAVFKEGNEDAEVQNIAGDESDSSTEIKNEEVMLSPLGPPTEEEIVGPRMPQPKTVPLVVDISDELTDSHNSDGIDKLEFGDFDVASDTTDEPQSVVKSNGVTATFQKREKERTSKHDPHLLGPTTEPLLVDISDELTDSRNNIDDIDKLDLDDIDFPSDTTVELQSAVKTNGIEEKEKCDPHLQQPKTEPLVMGINDKLTESCNNNGGTDNLGSGDINVASDTTVEPRFSVKRKGIKAAFQKRKNWRSSKYGKSTKFKIVVMKMKKPLESPCNKEQVAKALKFINTAGKQVQNKSLKTDLKTASDPVADTPEVQKLGPEPVQNSEDINKKIHVCVYCKKEIDGRASLISHHISVHPTKVFYCDKCNIYCHSKESLSTHLRKHQGLKGNIPIRKGHIEVKSIDENVEISKVVNVNVDRNSPSLSIKTSNEFEEIDNPMRMKILEAITHMVSNKKKLCVQNEKKRQLKRWQCKQCNHVSSNGEEFRRHKTTHLPLIHTCQFCDKSFRSKMVLKYHERGHIQDKTFICEYCGKHFKYQNTLRSHLITHGKFAKTHKCTDCDKAFTNRNSLNIHMESHSTEHPYLCEICGKKMKHISNFRVHRKLHLDPDYRRKYMCEECGKQHLTRGRLVEHKRLHTEERPLTCETCGKRFRTQGQLSQHLQIHVNARRHSCDICGKRFNRRGNMLSHKKRHNIHNCGVCDTNFAKSGELQAHLSTHTAEEIEFMKQSTRAKKGGEGNESNVCQLCHKVLGSKPSLMYHMRIHSGEKPYCCEICGKKFSGKSSLSIHQLVHSDQKPYVCRFCQKGCLSKSTLIVHERHHTGEKPFSCQLCDMAFRSKMNLNQHLVVHSDARPFICPHCTKRFRRRDALDIHMRIHTGERPYSCKVCGKRFKQRGDCNKHERAHSKPSKQSIEIFQCFACDQTFSNQNDCNTHIMETHVDNLFLKPADTFEVTSEEVEKAKSEEIETLGHITIEAQDLSSCNTATILHTDILGSEVSGNECSLTASDLFTV